MAGQDRKASEEIPSGPISDGDFWRGVQNGGNVRFSFTRVRAWIEAWATKTTVGLNNVDNTSDATKNSAPGTLLNKTIDAALNTISNLTTTMFGANVIDTDGALAANSDSRIPSQKAVRTAINALIGANDVEVFKGAIDCSGNPNYPAADAGHVYRVSVAGKIGGASGVNLEIGDRLQCIVDGTVSGNQAAVGPNWWVTQANLDGAVIGPASATDGLPALFDGTTGKLLKNSTWAAFRNALLDSITNVQGSILYRGASGWAALGPGTSGHYFKTNGSGADPTWAAVAGGGSARDLLAANRTYYVRADGSDANSGTANTAGGAFLTIQKAIDTVAALDLGTFDVTIQVADGTWTSAIALKSTVGAGLVTLQGNIGSRDNVLISTSATCIAGISFSGRWAIRGMKLVSSSGALIDISRNSAEIAIGNVNFGSAAGPHIRARSGASILLDQSYGISGSATIHFNASGLSTISVNAPAVTISGTPAFSVNFAFIQRQALLDCRASITSFSGAATGSRYYADTNSVIYTESSGATYFPGNAAGSVATGGQYI